MRTVIDFHSHVLPGIDDGSSSLEESIALLRLQSQQGIGHVVATPHFYANYDRPDCFLQRRDEAEALLRREMEKYNDLPALHMGAEVYFFRGISESEYLRQLCIRGTDCILIEMMSSPWPEVVYSELEKICRRGITPVIAHIDRYIAPFRSHGIPGRLAELPVLVQANADFFLDSRSCRMAMKMLKNDQIHLLGSDCHNLRSRPPELGEAMQLIKRMLGEAVLRRVSEYGESVLLSAEE